MNKKENFKELVKYAMAEKKYIHMRPVIAKELLHYDILFVLEKEQLLDTLTFQGGTCLRLCYNAPRFSEDLDFVGGTSFTTKTLTTIKDCLEHYIGERYGLEISVKEPKELRSIPEYRDIRVDKWQIGITTEPERKDLPKQKVKLEVANIPAYSHTPRSLQVNYDFLPDGYTDILVMSETLDEIMADKLVSFVDCQRYVRHRDIWDLRWLKQQGASINSNYILSKIQDYKINDYLKKLNNTLTQLENIIHGKAFRDEMSRFIPIDFQERTLKKQKFFDVLIYENSALLHEVKKIVTKST